MAKPKKPKRHVGKWEGRVYVGRGDDGKQLFEWVGRFDTKRERDDAVRARKDEWAAAAPELPEVESEVVAYMEWYADEFPKSVPQRTEQLKRFRADFAGRSVDIPREELKEWAAAKGKWAKDASGKRTPIPNTYLFGVSAFYTFVIDEQDRPLAKNPARKLGKQTKGRSETPPPTEAEFAQLMEATAALGEAYAPTIRALFEFAAFTLMRPSELYALKWDHIDFSRNRIEKKERVYRGKIADPKTGEKEIALTPPAKSAIAGLPRTSPYVFPSKTGKRMSASGFSGYWGKVQARAGLEFEFYLASKHYGVWYMWTQMEMSQRLIAAQAGWSEKSVEKLIKVYGHGEVGALDDIDAAFASHRPKLRALKGGKAAQ